ASSCSQCAAGYYGANCENVYTSCQAALIGGQASSGTTTVDPDGNGGVVPFAVHCDQTTAGGGWTLFSPDQLGTLGFDVNAFASDKTQVLFYLRHSDGRQFYTVAQQLPAYAGYDLTWSELSSDHLRVTFIPVSVAAAAGATQGLRSNGTDLTFVNCDANPNSYLEFYRTGASYSQASDYNLAYAWRDTKLPLTDAIPVNYFGFTAMHFGGCGTHSTSPYWSTYDGMLDAAMAVR
ncbi:MAG: hypothetical protein COW42_00915, partial [Deltaproteobacteria bacterium CG17_big_fil_post_rev_8_21_14_2_50_63_7]